MGLLRYLLAEIATIPLWGRLADMFGRKRIFLAGMIIFLVGSALSGMAGSMTQLVAFRGLQGVGGGIGVVVSFLMPSGSPTAIRDAAHGRVPAEVLLPDGETFVIADPFDEEDGETELEAQPQRAEVEMAGPGA